MTVAPVHVLVRVWVIDRPGALGLVASRIGAVRGDIVAMDVLEQADGRVIDEFAVDLPDESIVDVLVREIGEVDGASVEQVRVVPHFPDARIDALESAALLAETTRPGELQSVLVEHVRAEFLADWAALTDGRSYLAATESAPGTDAVVTLASSATPPDDLAAAVLPGHGSTLLVGRREPPFRQLERNQLVALARIADRIWALIEP